MKRLTLLWMPLGLILACGAVWGNSVLVTNPNFAIPGIDCNAYAYQSTNLCNSVGYPTQDFNNVPGFGWVFAGGVGLTRPGSAFNPPTPPANTFTQAAFLQGDAATISQTLTAGPGYWTVSFYLGARQANGGYDGNQTVQVTLDGNLVGNYALNSFDPYSLRTTTPVSLLGGPHTLVFSGTANGDHTAFISGVSANVPDGGVTLMLLGGALVGLETLRRKFRA